MPTKKRKVKTNSHSYAKRPPQANPNATIQYIAIGVIVLVVIALAYSIVNSLRETSEQATATAMANSAPTPGAVSDAFAAGGKTYDSYPPMVIDTGKQYTATVKMAKGGEFQIQLFADKAPKTVNSFVFLARDGYFDGVTFHRVLEGFMAQGGDPTGTGMGGPGYEFENEDSDLVFDKAGMVAMANAGRDTNGSQFFITFAPAEHLNGGYTLFGQVTEGMDVVNALTRRDPDQNPDFQGDVIESVTISEN